MSAFDTPTLRAAQHVACAAFQAQGGDLAHAGLVDRVDVLASDRLRFRFTKDGATTYEAGVPMLTWPIEVEQQRSGEWIAVPRSNREPIDELMGADADP